MRILLAGSYAAPNEFGGNRNFFHQASSLVQAGVDVTILTSSSDKTWQALNSQEADIEEQVIAGIHCKCFSFNGVKYIVGEYPPLWFRRDVDSADWDSACQWARKVIDSLKPEIVHLHFWRGHFWVLEAAQSLGVSTIYTAHDFGLGCSRTVLLKGDGDLCDGVVGQSKCSQCVMDGRSFFGLANEVLVRSPLIKNSIDRMYRSPQSWLLHKYEVLSDRVENRVEQLLSRAKRILAGIDVVFTSNPLATQFFAQFVDSFRKIHEIPWYSTLPVRKKNSPTKPEGICLGYMGRISEEKGLDILLEALLQVPQRVKLKIAGSVKGKYASVLRKKAKYLNHHELKWLGWVSLEAQSSFYDDIDAIVVPSRCMDNLPLTILDAFSQGIPVICPDIPSLTGVVKHRENGILFSFNSIESLADSINLIIRDRVLLANLAEGTRPPLSLSEYTKRLIEVYKNVLGSTKETIAGY